MFAIYKREFKSHINSFIGLLFMAVTLFFIGIYYTFYQLISGSPYFSVSINAISIICWISIPVLCMKVFSEERHNKTDQLTLTAPVSVGQIVLGKYLALVSILGITTLIICLYPLILSAYGTILVGETFTAIFGYFLYCSASIAICVLISSLTESQVIAAVLGFGALCFGNLTTNLSSLIGSNVLVKVLQIYDLATPFGNLLNGVFDITSIVYFLSVIAFSLFLTTQVIQKRRYTVSVKHLSMGAYSTGTIAIVAALVLVVNVFLGQLPSTWTIVDFSTQKLYSITDTTKKFLDTLEQDVDLYLLSSEEDAHPTIVHTLERYRDYSDHISVTYIDPITNPNFVTQYTDASVSSNSVVVVSGDKHKVLDYFDLWDWSASGSDITITGYDAEGQITGAISYVTTGSSAVFYVTEGHTEAEIPEYVSTSLSKENIAVETINLKDVETVPEDACALFIHAPELDLNEYEANVVMNFIDNGGVVILVTGSADIERPYCEAIMEHMGLSLVDGMIIEGNTDFYYQNQLYITPNISSMDYTEVIVNNKYSVFAPYSQGIVIEEELIDHVYTPIMNTSKRSYSKVNLSSATLEKEENDIAGPFYIGMEVSNTLGGGKLVVYSCSQMFLDGTSTVSNGTNQYLLVCSVTANTDVQYSITVPMKSYQVNMIMVPNVAVLVLGVLTIAVLPISLIVAGFVIWFKRRRQ